MLIDRKIVINKIILNDRNNGFKLGIVTESVVYHKEGASTGADKNPNKK